MLVNSCLPSGTWMMPSSRMKRLDLPTSSVPLNCSDPLVGWIMPVMARTVVVFPAPLDPSMATTSPSFTSKEMSQSTWMEP